jgi:hypothetical protein
MPLRDEHDDAIGDALHARGIVVAVPLIATKNHDISGLESVVLTTHAELPSPRSQERYSRVPSV